LFSTPTSTSFALYKSILKYRTTDLGYRNSYILPSDSEYRFSVNKWGNYSTSFIAKQGFKICTSVSVISDHVIDERKIDVEHWIYFRVTVRIYKMEYGAVCLVAANKILFSVFRKTDTQRAANAFTSLWRHISRTGQETIGTKLDSFCLI